MKFSMSDKMISQDLRMDFSCTNSRLHVQAGNFHKVTVLEKGRFLQFLSVLLFFLNILNQSTDTENTTKTRMFWRGYGTR